MKDGGKLFYIRKWAKKAGHLPALPEGRNNTIATIMNEDEKEQIVKELAERVALTQKAVLTSEEVARYLGISLSRLYKLTSAKEIPHYKPNGKINYFERAEIEAWALRNRIATNAEINEKAMALSTRRGNRT